MVTCVTTASVGTIHLAIFPDCVTHCGYFSELPDKFITQDRYCLFSWVNGNEHNSPISVGTKTKWHVDFFILFNNYFLT